MSKDADIQSIRNEFIADMKNMTGFITQEVIKSAQANKGQLADAASTEHKGQTNSLLNADPKAPENQGKPTISLKGTEQGIQEKIDKMISKGTPAAAFDDIKAELAGMRKDFESKLSTNSGLKKLVDDRIKNEAIKDAYPFVNADKDGKPIEGLVPPKEKQKFADLTKDAVTVTPVMREAYLTGNRNGQLAVAAGTARNLAKAFSVEGKITDYQCTLDPQKLTPEKIQKFQKSMTVSAVEKTVDNLKQGFKEKKAEVKQAKQDLKQDAKEVKREAIRAKQDLKQGFKNLKAEFGKGIATNIAVPKGQPNNPQLQKQDADQERKPKDPRRPAWMVDRLDKSTPDQSTKPQLSHAERQKRQNAGKDQGFSR